jgi:hypothetical protein
MLKAQDYTRTVITDPSISRRCDALLEQRNLKVGHKQHLAALIVRAEKLLKVAPPERSTVVKRLRRTKQHLEQEMELTLSKLQFQEENIIRKGCPGIVL